MAIIGSGYSILHQKQLEKISVSIAKIIHFEYFARANETVDFNYNINCLFYVWYLWADYDRTEVQGVVRLGTFGGRDGQASARGEAIQPCQHPIRAGRQGRQV